MARVLVAGTDWRFRALVRAQLLEEGVEAEAYETAREALSGVRNLNALPALLVVDLFDRRDPHAELQLLAKWASLVPAWIIARPSLAAEIEAGEIRAERVIYRPVDVGELIKEIKQRISS